MEVWKPIKGYEGLYEISSDGHVRSLCAGRGKNIQMNRALTPDKNGYLTINLKKDGKYVCHKVHRLVAQMFIPNPNKYPHINHKDEDKQNNTVDNLEWCTAEYNNLYHDKCKRCCKKVSRLDDSGNVLETYNSINEAAQAVGVTASHLSTVLSGRRPRNTRAGGYKWRKEN